MIKERSEPDSPDRCERDHCQQTRVPGTKFCHNHHKTQGRYNLLYHITEYNRIGEDLNFKSLRDETHMLRTMLEMIWNNSPTQVDMLINEPKLSALAEKISKLVQATHKLEAATGEVLDKSVLNSFVDSLIMIIAEEVPDEISLKKISLRMKDLLSTLTQKQMAEKSRDLDDA